MNDIYDQMEKIISRYLRGEMSPKERQDFLELIANSPAWTEKLEAETAIYQTLVEGQMIEWRSQMQNEYAKTKLRKNNWKFWLLIFGVANSLSGLVWMAIEFKKEEKPLMANTQEVLVQFPIRSTKADLTAETEIKGGNNPYVDSKETNKAQVKAEGFNSVETSSNNEVDFQSPVNQTDSKTFSPNESSPPTPVIQKVAKEDPCKEFHPTFETVVLPSNVEEQTGEIHFKNPSEKIVFYFENDPNVKGLHFQHLAAGNYAFVAKNELGCSAGPWKVQIKSTYCKEDHQHKHYLTTGPYHPEFHPQAEAVTVYDKLGRLVEQLDKTSNYVWDLLPTQSTGLYMVVIQYPNGEKCQYSLTIFN